MKKFLFVLTMLLLPAAVFAKGDIIAYVPYDHHFVPTDDQLDKLTHLALFAIIPGADGTMYLPSGGWTDNIGDMVNRAHNKNVKVIIVFAGGKNNFSQNVQETNRETFTDNIINIVNQYNFDGVDIDYEFPSGSQQRKDFGDFLILLKQKLGNKRLSFAIGQYFLPTHYSKATYAAIDALHVMTYDLVETTADHHADMEETKKMIDNFLTSGLIDKNKVFYGVPFYGRNRTNNADAKTYASIISGNEATLSQQDSDGTYNYDGLVQVKEKTRYAYEKGAGGIMIWAISQDVFATSRYSLLNAIWQQTQELKPGAPISYKINITYSGGGIVKKATGGIIASQTQINVQKDNGLTLIFNQDSGYYIADVNINGVSDSAAITSGTYTFDNVNADADIEIIFIKKVVEYLAKPAITNTAIVYTGNEQSAGIATNAHYTITGGTATNAGDYRATVVLKDKDNYEWADGTTADLALPWSIAKATGVFGSPAEFSATYSPTLKLENLSLPENYVWNTPEIVLNAGNNQSFAATFTDPSGNYETATGSIVVNVEKATPSHTKPSDLTATVGQTLADVSLNKHSGWEWVNPDTLFGETGTHTHFAKFTPEDTANYHVLEHPLTVSVSEATPTDRIQKSDGRVGIRLSKTVVSDKAEFEVILPDNDKAQEVKAVVYDNTSNVVFTTTQRGASVSWNLTNGAGRNVANGTYLIVVEAKGAKGIYAYSAKVGVKR